MPSNRQDKVTVKVLHNEGFFYTAAPRLTQVLEFESDFPACGHVWPLLDYVYRQLTNADNSDDPSIDWDDVDWANRYRADERALSVGDVVIVSEQAWAVEWIAWRRVDVHAAQISNRSAGNGCTLH
jgi:hypothetical protein